MMSTGPAPDQKPAPAPQEARKPGCGRRLVKWTALGLAVVVLLLLVAVAGGGLWLRAQLRASLPQLAGERSVSGLTGPVVIDRDALGIPTIQASNRRDVAFATGFLHAQERFVQMDLQRRQAAGELAELIGRGVVGVDRRNRIYRLRWRAGRILANSAADVRAVVEAYSAGVNAGLDALSGKPFEYLPLGVEPAPWMPEDTIVVLLGMFLRMEDSDGYIESQMGLMHEVLPAELCDFLVPPGTEWEAPIQGEPFSTPPIPGPEVFDLRVMPRETVTSMVLRPREPLPVPGSNSWAVSGAHTAHGGALLANELHLALSVPNLWYRASFSWPAGDGSDHRVTGATLPGAPVMVVGSNAHVAWGYSKSLIDTSDVVLLEPDPEDENRYLTPDGARPFDRHEEIVRVKGGDDLPVEVRSTIWGPVFAEDHRGRPWVLRWAGQDDAAVDLEILRLETAFDLDQVLEAAHRSGMPAMNLVAADSAGRIAWTIVGKIPRRIGFDGRLPGSWADGERHWEGFLSPAEVPQVVDPESGRVWTANNRVVGGEELAALGDGGYLLGARARQIRDDLLAVERATREDMLRIQLDDRALFLARWRDLLLEILTPEAIAAEPRRGELRELVEDWGGRAATESAGYRMVRTFRLVLASGVFAALTAPVKEVDPDFDYLGTFPRYEGPLWKLVRERPLHLLDPRYESWEDQLLAAVDKTLDHLWEEGRPLSERTWGEHNTTAIRHPFSRGIPGAARWLDMPAERLPGGEYMPRAQRPSFGATLRMVVSPGREEQGFFHMPCGQSGHPLSPHYRDGHAAWAEGKPTPFLPGPTVNTLTLLPAE